MEIPLRAKRGEGNVSEANEGEVRPGLSGFLRFCEFALKLLLATHHFLTSMSKLIAFLLLATLAHAEQFGAGHALEYMSHRFPTASTQSSNLIIGAGRDSLIVTKDTVINGDLTILHHGALVI